jgi:hypothetical protein
VSSRALEKRGEAGMTSHDESQIKIFWTSPQSKDFLRESYVQQVINVAHWSEEVHG